ncbi:peptidylprolyl isomerase [Furfurilactobacillus rossiae]|uniref:Foldase protein PrsA n=1 Tax=Furfurilactobacillus rossiae DSM 15814 TaxID=1114972 RepID=A0A0R1RW04_9LACO|nr:peptidylprolyl isomerase [Furfurilactobacillus rossiae]KRL57427.1 Foldase protein prsA [Furfurilactobacillus rossiae DSM 15814]MCF6164830.1 peptidylprolyl isomerase [Furfurilactobacillus rossiae]QFR65706.1 peptidylprolyl isomerase [Furfurilactobacillus rossiae]QLE61102.1 Foldase protein PrsA precursor [Furfurilactobacillus rossiae]QLE63844.1 Foldase protein PrsA precursor [Furfurilactobacillus rossiae]
MKKWLLVPAGLVMAFSLAACGNKTVATTNGGKITQDQYYSSMKTTSQGKQVLQQMIIKKVLEKNYGSKVSSSKVNKQYDTVKKQYGSSFNSMLTQQGMTASSLKDTLRMNLLLKEAVKNDVKITDSDLKKQFKSWEPKVSTAVIVTSKKDTATKAIDELNSGTSFTKVAKKYSEDTSSKNKGGKVGTFDNASTSVDDSIKTAAFKLNNGEYTKTPVTDTNSQTGTKSYYVIKMLNKPSKGTWTQHKQDLKEQIWNQDMDTSNGGTVLQSVIAKELKKGNVNIKDNDLKDVLSQYTSTSSSSAN